MKRCDREIAIVEYHIITLYEPNAGSYNMYLLHLSWNTFRFIGYS